jgi:hypothetical protein
MLKGAKLKLYSAEEDVMIMPSTLALSGFVNNFALLATIGILFIVGYVAAMIFIIFGAWQVGVSIIGGQLLFGRALEWKTRTTAKRKGYIKTSRQAARKLMNVEQAFAKLSKDDRDMYKGYLEGAYYGDATPEKVIEFFDHKLQEAHRIAYETPKPFDELIDMELPKDKNA